VSLCSVLVGDCRRGFRHWCLYAVYWWVVVDVGSGTGVSMQCTGG